MKQVATRTKRRQPQARAAAQEPAQAAPLPRRESGWIAIHAAQRSDVAQVTALDGEITGLPKPEHWMELYRRQRGAPAGIFLIATPADDRERVLGFIIGEIRAWEFGSGPCGWVYALSVRPEVRERGVAEALLDRIAEEFRKAGMGKMRTMVARDALLPMRFFRGEGLMAGPYVQLEKDL